MTAEPEDPAQAVEHVLEQFRSGFQADGADIVVREVKDGQATVELLLSADTCLECIVPPPTLQVVIGGAIVGKIAGVQAVTIVDPRTTA